MKFVLKYSFLLSVALIGTIPLSIPCSSAKIDEDNVPVLLHHDQSKLTNLRGVARSAQAKTTTMTTTTTAAAAMVTRDLNIHDDQVERKLQTITANLTNGVARKGLSGYNTYFALRNVPAGKIVTCTTSSDISDASDASHARYVDVYVKIGGPVVDLYSNADCGGTYHVGRDDSCAVGPLVNSSDVFIELYGNYTNVTLVCSFPTSVPNLQSAVPRTGLSGDAYSLRYFALRNVTPGSIVTCTTSSGTDVDLTVPPGDVDLSVKIGSLSRMDYPHHDCESYRAGTDDFCAVGPIVNTTDVYIRLQPDEPYTNLVLTCSSSGSVENLRNGVAMTNLSGFRKSNRYFVLPYVPVGKHADCRYTGTGVKLYVKKGSLSKIISNPDCSRNVESEGSCLVGPMGATTDIYLNLFGDQAYTGATLICYIIQDVQPAVPRSRLSGVMGSNTYFALRNVTGGVRVTCTTSGGNIGMHLFDNVDLYMKIGSLTQIRRTPDCYSNSTFNADSCAVKTVNSTDVFIDLYGRKSYSGVTLTCNFATL